MGKTVSNPDPTLPHDCDGKGKEKGWVWRILSCLPLGCPLCHTALHNNRNVPDDHTKFCGISRFATLDPSQCSSPPIWVPGSARDSLLLGQGQQRPLPVPSEQLSHIFQDPCDPCLTAVHMETIFNSAFKFLI